MDNYYDKYIKYKLKNGGGSVSDLIKAAKKAYQVAVPHIKAAEKGLADTKAKINHMRKNSLSIVERARKEADNPVKKKQLHTALGKDHEKLIIILDRLIKFLHIENLSELIKHQAEILNLFHELHALAKRMPSNILNIDFTKLAI
jgi:CRISPR/Cas system CSM-associated protein Csm4 (group 5 of RAMP superfamily)